MPKRVGMFDNCMDWDECAELIPCAASSLKAQHDEWGVPSIRIAGRVWFIKEEVEAWVRARAVAHRKNANQAEALWQRQQMFAGK